MLLSFRFGLSSIMLAMELKFSTNQVNAYKIDTPVYQGPLDLLLQLIETAELDITTLSLAQVTNQYLKHLEELQDLPPDEVSAFLVIAAKLIQIKSEALLPQQTSGREEEIDIGNELARQLIAYKRYKEIADLLADRKDHGYQTFIRLSSSQLEINDQLDLTVVERPKITIKDKINQISDRFIDTDKITFRELLGKEYSRLDIVISFLALLELIKGNFIEVVQTKIFDDITVKKLKEDSEMREFAFRNLEL